MVVLSPHVLSELRMSIDEYLLADLPEGNRYELVEGVVTMSPVPGFLHDGVLRKLNRMLERYADAHPDLIAHISTRSALALRSRKTTREPDLSVYSPRDVGREPPGSWATIRPTLVIEIVSPGQEERDYEAKRADYWDAGVPEYWIVDPQRRTLTSLTRGAEEWLERVYDDQATFRPAAFEGLEIKIAGLFAA